MSVYNRDRYAWGYIVDPNTGSKIRLGLKDKNGNKIPWNPDPGSRDYQDALRAEHQVRLNAAKGSIRKKARKFGKTGLAAAIDEHIDEVSRRGRSTNTIRSLRHSGKALVQHWSPSVTLFRITSDQIVEFQEAREKHGISGRTINMNIALLTRLLRKGRIDLDEDVERKEENHDAGRALTPDELARLFEVSKTNDRWYNARLAATIAANTSLRGAAIRGWKWKHVDFLERTVTIEKDKTPAGKRRLPLNPEAFAAVLELRERAKLWFGDNLDQEWYVFPHREGYTYPDPTQPMKGWRTAWRNMTRKAGLHRFRFHDLRHTVITILAENPNVSEETLRSIAGHVSKRMLEHYSHIRLEAKRKALDALVGPSKPEAKPLREGFDGFEGILPGEM